MNTVTTTSPILATESTATSGRSTGVGSLVSRPWRDSRSGVEPSRRRAEWLDKVNLQSGRPADDRADRAEVRRGAHRRRAAPLLRGQVEREAERHQKSHEERHAEKDVGCSHRCLFPIRAPRREAATETGRGPAVRTRKTPVRPVRQVYPGTVPMSCVEISRIADPALGQDGDRTDTARVNIRVVPDRKGRA